jgi:hypothetical protein
LISPLAILHKQQQAGRSGGGVQFEWLQHGEQDRIATIGWPAKKYDDEIVLVLLIHMFCYVCEEKEIRISYLACLPTRINRWVPH